MEKKNFIFVICLVLIFGIVTVICFSNGIKFKEVSNDNFTVKYDSTWKVVKNDSELSLLHKKSNGTLDIKCKVLSDNYIDTKLSDLIDDIIYSISDQNKDYVLINRFDNVSDKYESYSYLYEKDNKQVMVNVYKKYTKLVIVYYEASSDYFDIVLDSVQGILDSLDIIVGEK
jgi:hypothetical protein